MKKYSLIFVLLLFAVLTVIYFRNSIFCGPDVLITRHLGSDLYSYLYHAVNQLQWLKHGFIPIANYWVPHGGGFPASPMDQLIVPSNLVLMGLYAITHNILTVLRIFDPLMYFVTLLTTYWFGRILFDNKRIPSIVLAVAYTFSMYGVGQLEHLDLLSAMVLIPLTLGFLELMLRSSRNKYIVLTAFFAFLVYLTHPYAAFFLLAFIGLRFLLKLVTEKERVKSTVNMLKLAGLVLLMSLPFLALQLTQLPSTATDSVAAYSQPSGLFFFRLIPSFVTPEITMYLGISIVVVALLPIVFGKTNKTYILYLAVAVIAIIYSAGKYGPINLAQIVHNYGIWFIRVPGRAMIIGSLALAVCTGIGIQVIKSKWQYVVATVAIIFIFVDLTIGYEPPTVAVPLDNNATYQWLAQQQEDFRIVEIPSVYAQAALTNMYTNHDTLGWTLWDYGYYGNLGAPGTVYQRYVDETESAVDAATYDVKYVIVNTDFNIFVTMKDDIASGAPISDLKDYSQVVALKGWLDEDGNYKEVYQQGTWTVFENLQWKGFVCGNGVVSYSIVNNNKITINVATSTPTTVNVSQSFDKGWKTNIGMLTANDSEQQLNLPAGKYVVTLTYIAYTKSLLWFLIWIPLLGAIVWMLRRRHETR